MSEEKVTYSYDPREYIRMLKQILISDSKKIGFLSGAGTSVSINKEGEKFISAMEEMTETIIKEVKQSPKFIEVIKDIEDELIKKKEKFQLENILSVITQKASVIGKGTLSGLDESGFEELKKNIENQIKDSVSVHNNKNLKIEETPHFDLATWIVQASRKYPIEIFTTNYDYLFEMALEEHKAPYFDGFIGGYTPFFYPDAIEQDDKSVPKWTRLWKVHGSLGWKADDKGMVVKGNKNVGECGEEGDIMIYPSTLKYAHSKKQPYVSLIDRLKDFVKQEDSVLFVLGYSFGDQHINETIMSALSKSRISHVYAFKRSDLKETDQVAKLAMSQKKLSVYGMRHAVIGGVYGEWRLRDQPQKEEDIKTYFEQDEVILNEEFNGKGKFTLGAFEKYVKFLNVLSWNNSYKSEKSDNNGV
ncbi:SIR2 family NAD-dependent protein deacylase [Clostridium tagluense]|uniref:SIR2 family protein n=1 Tax=Clostridium tagluense TaxID=360422 RepID=A0A401UNI5_9CLOT|nr:SIR2 family protein [Clostridium tagluense]GCD11088.1 SIR2 family protein [Clostridium tagluense]